MGKKLKIPQTPAVRKAILYTDHGASAGEPRTESGDKSFRSKHSVNRRDCRGGPGCWWEYDPLYNPLPMVLQPRKMEMEPAVTLTGNQGNSGGRVDTLAGEKEGAGNSEQENPGPPRRAAFGGQG